MTIPAKKPLLSIVLMLAEGPNSEVGVNKAFSSYEEAQEQLNKWSRHCFILGGVSLKCDFRLSFGEVEEHDWYTGRYMIKPMNEISLRDHVRQFCDWTLKNNPDPAVHRYIESRDLY